MSGHSELTGTLHLHQQFPKQVMGSWGVHFTREHMALPLDAVSDLRQFITYSRCPMFLLSMDNLVIP